MRTETFLSGRSPLVLPVTFTLFSVGALGHSLWSKASDGGVQTVGSVSGALESLLAIAPWLFFAVCVRMLLLVRLAFGVGRLISASVFVWAATCAVSLVVHRGSDQTLTDTIVAAVTAGEWPRAVPVAGLEFVRQLMIGLLLAVLCSAPSLIRLSKYLTSALAVIGGIFFFAFDSAADVFEGTSRPISLLIIVGALSLASVNFSPMRIKSKSTSSFIGLLLIGFGVGIAAFGTSISNLLARQHVERVTVDTRTGAVTQFVGPVLPLMIWTTIAAALLGVLLFLPGFFLASRLRRDPSRFSTSQLPAHVDGRRQESVSFLLGTAWVVALGFWVRIATLLTVAPTRTDGGDPLFYHVTANLLAQGRGLPEPLNFIAFQRWIPSALHGPAYPIVLSISSRLGGTTYFDHKVLSILIGTAIVGVTMLLAYRISPSNLRGPTTLIAGVLCAVYPNLWLVDSVLFPEGLMALLTLGVVLAAYSWWSRPNMKTAAAIGALIAASALTRGEGLLLSVLLVVPLFLSMRRIDVRRRWLHLVLAGLSCVVVIAPWSLRNAQSFESFVPLSTNGNELFVYANCPPVYEGKFVGFWLFQCQEDLRASLGEPTGDEAEKALYWRQQGLDYAREHVEDLPRVLAARIGRQWDIFRPWQNTEFAPIEGRDKDAARMGLVMYFGMIPCALLGAVRLRRNGTRLVPFGAVFASVTLTAAYAYGTTRFRVPFEPLLCLLAAIGLAAVWKRLRTRWQASPLHVSTNLLGSRADMASFVLGGPLRRVWSKDSVRTWISYGVVAIGVVVALPALYRSVGSSMEEGFMLVFPELLNRGLIPNVDFLHLYGPGALRALAVWFDLFGTTLTAERTFGLMQHIAFLTGMMTLVRPWGRLAVATVGSVSLLFVLTPIGLQALAWNGALGLGIWSVIFGIRASNQTARSAITYSWLTCGALAGLALTFRPDVAVALALSIGFLVWKRSRREISTVSFGALLGLGPFWWHLVEAGPRAVVNGMFLDPVLRLRAGRELPRPPSIDRLDGALQVISEKFAPWWGFPHVSAPKQLFIWFFLLPLVSIGVLLVAKSMPTFRVERSALLAGALFGVGLLPQALQRPDSAHFLWVSAVSWPLAIIALLEWSRRRRPRSHPRVHLIVATTALMLTVLIAVPFYTVRTYADLVVRSVSGQLEVREVRRGERVFYLGDERPWRATLEVVQDLGALAKPGERLFVGPVDLRQTAYSDAFFYHLFPELEPATYYIEMDPGLANQDDRLSDDLRSADWLVLTRFWSGWIEPNESIIFGSDLPNQIVEDSFCLEGSYQNDLVRLFRRCARGDGVGPYEGPYRPEHDYAVEVLVPVPPRPDGTCTPTCRGKPSSSGVEIGIDTSVVN